MSDPLPQPRDDDVVLVDTKDIHEFLPLMKELREFGDRFLLTMLRWCGYGRERAEPLAFWQVYIAKVGDETVGVTGLYRDTDTPTDMCWMGWFGVRPAFRGIGIGNRIVEELKIKAQALSYKEMWVYTDKQNARAIQLYESAGFVRLGAARKLWRLGTSHASHIVLRCRLKQPFESD
jgi:RimJ/RimL family protein N-acetyltransferase